MSHHAGRLGAFQIKTDEPNLQCSQNGREHKYFTFKLFPD